MKILHYNDEERELHDYLAQRGHANVVLHAETDPFVRARAEAFEAAFIGLHPHGLQLIRALHRRNPDCLVTMITADRNARMAVEAMKLGAFDYLLTPLDFAEIERTVIMMMREHQGQHERKGLEGRLADSIDVESDAAANTPSIPRGTLKEIVSDIERRAIERARGDYQGNIARAARALAISRTTLYAKLRSVALSQPSVHE